MTLFCASEYKILIIYYEDSLIIFVFSERMYMSEKIRTISYIILDSCEKCNRESVGLAFHQGISLFHGLPHSCHVSLPFCFSDESPSPALITIVSDKTMGQGHLSDYFEAKTACFSFKGFIFAVHFQDLYKQDNYMKLSNGINPNNGGN